MRAALIIAAAVVSYLVGGINPAIILSNRLYKLDLRRFGSHNAGFTNFRRVLGDDNAWLVLIWDFLKSACMCALFGWLFGHFLGRFRLGAAIAMLCAVIGHAYPVWYEFKGGKSVAVFGAAMWFVDWRAGFVTIGVFLVMLLTFRYMSLAALCAGLGFLLSLGILWTPETVILVLMGLSVAIVWWRHRENIGRLLRGTESKFSFHS